MASHVIYVNDSKPSSPIVVTPLKLAELIEREFGGLVPPKMFDD